MPEDPTAKANGPGNGSTGRPLTVDDLWTIGRTGGPALSPDGRLVAFQVTEFDSEKNNGRGSLWLAPFDGSAPPRRITWNAGRDSGPVWSPDSRWLAFLSRRGEDKAQLYRLPMHGGEAEPLTELPVAVRAAQWLPDGSGLVFSALTFADLNDDFEAVGERLEAQKEDKTQARISESRLLRYWDGYRTDGSVVHLFHLDLESREVRDLMPGFDRLTGFSVFRWDLAPDGREIAFAANGTPRPWRDLRFDIFRLDRQSGEIRNLTDDSQASDGMPIYSPDGRWLVFARVRRPQVSPDFQVLMRLDRQTGELRELVPDWDSEPEFWRFTDDSRTLLLHAQDAGRRHLYALPIAGAEAPRRIAAGGHLSSIDPGPEGRAVLLHQTFHQPAQVMALEPGSESLRPLGAVAQEHLQEVDFGATQEIRFPGAAGREAQIFLHLPPGFDPGRRWPLVLLAHGGPHSAWLDTFHYRWSAPLFAAAGYVAAQVNCHGSTGFGQAYAESLMGDQAAKPYEDLMLATDLLIERGYADPERLAAAGGSYGGYLTSWILGHTDRFACLICHAGVFDLMGQYASDYTWHRGQSYGAEPWDDLPRIDTQSPSRFVEHFNTPTLVLHGERDYRVPYTQGVQLYQLLKAKGVPARIAIFPKENHWILKPQAAKIWWQEVFAWLERYLGKGPS